MPRTVLRMVNMAPTCEQRIPKAEATTAAIKRQIHTNFQARTIPGRSISKIRGQESIISKAEAKTATICACIGLGPEVNTIASVAMELEIAKIKTRASTGLAAGGSKSQKLKACKARTICKDCIWCNLIKFKILVDPTKNLV